MLWADHSKAAISSALRSLRLYDGGTISRPTYSIYPIEIDLSKQSWAPRPYESFRRFSLLQQPPNKPVEDFFDVKQGVRTGDNQAFVLERSQFTDIPKRERRYFRDAVVNKSIRDGRIVDPVHLFFPYGDHVIESEAVLIRAVPYF